MSKKAQHSFLSIPTRVVPTCTKIKSFKLPQTVSSSYAITASAGKSFPQDKTAEVVGLSEQA